MVALDDLAPIFQLTVREDALAGGLTVSHRGKTIVLTPDQGLASVNGRLISLSVPPVRDGKRWLVPIQFVTRAIAPIYESRIELRPASRLLIVGDLRVPRVVVRHELLGSQARVTIEMTPAAPATVTQEPGRLLVKLDADAIDASVQPFTSQDIVQSIRTADTTVTLDLGPRFGSFRSSTLASEAGGGRVVVDVLAAPEAGPAQPAPSTQPRPEAPPPVVTAPPGMRTIVIDPGHGGQDAGVHGASGTLEKDVTISVARRVKAAIEGRIGLRVLLTRNGDQAVASDDRASVANNNKADLFLSLHANASLQHQLKGAEVFYLDADSYGEEPKKLPPAGAGERLPVVGGGTREIELIPWELAQTRYVEQSGLLARDIEEQMRGRVLLAPLPIEQAPLRALVGASMPAVLVEMGFLSNPEQEQQLASSDYQNTIAQALVDAIVHFRDDLERARAGLAYQTSAAGRRPRLPER